MDQHEHPLLDELANNLSHAFKQVVLLYQQRLFAFAYRLTNSTLDAEDIVQEAFMSAYVSLENYSAARIRALKLQAWLYRVTLNVYTHSARRSRLQLVPLVLEGDGVTFEVEDREEERPEALFEQRERRQELEALVTRLPERYRVAVTCYFFEHLSYQEIADLLDQPLGTVKSNISRGVRVLRTMLSTSEAAERGRAHGAS